MRSTLVGLVALAVGCAHAPGTHGPAPGQWTELTSRHFTLRTDLSRKQALAALADFEGVYSTLETVAFPGDAPRERINVILFADEETFRRLAPRGASGYFMPRQADDPEPQPTIAIYGQMLVAGTLVEATQRRFRHELTHQFLDHRLRWTQPWLEEGLAEYYSTLRLAGDGAVVGTFPNTKILRVDIHTQGSLLGVLIDNRVDLSEVPTVRELLSADYSTFHDPAHDFAYYAGAWSFVHMMLNGSFSYKPHFERFLDLLAAGETPSVAWSECFWSVPLSRLERDFKRYVTRSEMENNTYTVAVPRAKKPDYERAMGADEVHLLLARTIPWDSRASILAAGGELAEARRLAGDHASAELHYWSGVYAMRWHHLQEAERELRTAIAMAPRAARNWLGLAEALQRDERDGAREELTEVVGQLAPMATSAYALHFLALYFAERGQLDAGLPYARRAVATEHGCWECAETLSELLDQANPPKPKAAAVEEEPGPSVKPTID